MDELTAVPGRRHAPDINPIERFVASGRNARLAMEKLEQHCARIQHLCANFSTETENEAVEELEAIAEELSDFFDIGYGMGFFKAGGVESITAIMQYPNQSTRATFAGVMASLAQHNEQVQNFLYENTNFLSEFMDNVVDFGLSSSYRTKLLSAISALVRGNPGGRNRFYDLSGPEKLEKAFENAFAKDETRVAGRSAIVAFHVYQDCEGNDERKAVLLPLIQKMKAQMATKPSEYAEPLEYITDL